MPINTAAHRTPSAGRARLPILIAAWLLIAAMALIGSGLPETAHAQAKRGAIPSPTLASNVPGQLVINWATPDPAPTDYRIRWANTDLGFPSYTAANEPERGNEYPLGDVNTLTLSNLTPGDSYKVQIRSRYYNADRSVHESSGPWTATATIRVMDEPAEPPQSDDQERTPTPTPMPMDENDDPPAAPMGLTVSRVGHSVLTLTWNDPQDANITGYRILRGTAADSLSTIQADTGSNGTEYEDDTVAAETTYFYAVLALSAAGNGPQSTILSATTPAAPKSKEQPPRRVGPRQINTSQALVSNLDQSVNLDEFFSQYDLAQGFTTGTNATGYTLSSVDVVLTVPSAFGFPVMKLFSGSANGTEVAALTAPASASTGATVYTYTVPAVITLTNNTSYWVMGEGVAGAAWITVSSVNEDATPAPGWSIADHIRFRSSSSTGAFDELGVISPFKIRVNGTINPLGPNQPPAFPGSSQTVTVDENATSGNLGLTPATDPENNELAYSVSGRDADAFREDFILQPVTAALRVNPNATIDYESRRSYRVTISVHDSRNTAHSPDTTIDDTLALTINVNNLDEPGAVEISSKNPEVGTAIQATVTDPDGNVRSITWQWYRGASQSGSFSAIADDATGSSYTPVQADVLQYLKAKATYTDGHGAAKEAEAIIQKATIPESTNQAASFRSERITLNVPDNSPNGDQVGDVSATDPNGDQLYYQLHHASVLDYQADFFERVFNLGYTNGLITVRDDTLLNYEGSEPLIVTIKLTDDKDPFGNYEKTWVWDDTTTLTINVINVDEPGTLDLEHVRSTTGAPTEVDTSFARLSDPDGVNRVVSWEWFRGDTSTGPFTEIDSGPFSDGTQSGFRPEESDIGKYLKVKVTYADVFSTKVIEQIMGPVERWVSPYPDYAFWPGRWTDSGDLAVGGTQTGVIQGGFLSNGRYIRDVPEFFELTGMTAGTTYEVNLSGPGYGVSDIMGFYTIDTEGGGLFFKSRGDGQPAGYTSAQLRHVLFTPRSAVRIFVGITGAFAAENLTYIVALSSR